MDRIEAITNEMAEYFCSSLCRNPHSDGLSQEELENICMECKMSRYICGILNERKGDVPVMPEIKGEYYVCPGCGARKSIMFHDNFCSRCGKAFIWKEKK